MLSNPKLKNTIQQVGKSIAAVLNVEIMIMDDKFTIVGGTAQNQGIYRVSNVYKYLMKTQKPVIIEKPGFHELCEGCALYRKCPEIAEIDSPIVLNGRSIGVISLVGYTEEHKKIMLSRKEDYLVFLTRMSEMISSKALEVLTEQKLEIAALQMTHIIDSVNEGIIALDGRGRITHCNKAVGELFLVPPSYMVGKKIETIIPKFISNDVIQGKVNLKNKEINFYTEKGEEIHCYISANPIINTDNKNVGAIILITDAGDMKKLVSNMMGYNHGNVQFSDIIGESSAIRKVKQHAKIVANSNSTVLIRGESGTGKELFARAIHNNSQVGSGPFITINCAAIPETLLESELFGYEGGAFTGARREGKPGKFELADGGTMFLDEIGDMPLYLQAKLLRVLQEKRIQRVGGVREIPIDVRIISATNKDLEELVSRGRFREDLFYRLNVIPIVIPPLAKRKEDISNLIDYFLDKYNVLFNKNIVSFSERAKEIFLSYSWPGNVRELENVLEYAMNMQNGNEITEDNLPNYLLDSVTLGETEEKTLQSMISKFEKEILLEKIREHGTNLEAKNQIAKDLDIGIATLYRKLKTYGIEQ